MKKTITKKELKMVVKVQNQIINRLIKLNQLINKLWHNNYKQLNNKWFVSYLILSGVWFVISVLILIFN